MRPCEEISRISARPSVVFPEPEFADNAERLPLAHADVDAVDRLYITDGAAKKAAPDRKPDAQIFAAHDLAGLWVGFRRVPLGLGRQQMPGIGMARLGENRGCRPLFDDLAALHDAGAVSDRPHDAEIVGDEQHRKAAPGAQFGKQLEDLRLHGDVECRRRLVGDQQLRIVGERHGDHHPLTLSAGKLVREGAEPRLRFANADLMQEFERARPRCRRAHAAVCRQDLANLALDGMQRI